MILINQCFRLDFRLRGLVFRRCCELRVVPDRVDPLGTLFKLLGNAVVRGFIGVGPPVGLATRRSVSALLTFALLASTSTPHPRPNPPLLPLGRDVRFSRSVSNRVVHICVSASGQRGQLVQSGPSKSVLESSPPPRSVPRAGALSRAVVLTRSLDRPTGASGTPRGGGRRSPDNVRGTLPILASAGIPDTPAGAPTETPAGTPAGARDGIPADAPRDVPGGEVGEGPARPCGRLSWTSRLPPGRRRTVRLSRWTS